MVKAAASVKCQGFVPAPIYRRSRVALLDRGRGDIPGTSQFTSPCVLCEVHVNLNRSILMPSCDGMSHLVTLQKEAQYAVKKKMADYSPCLCSRRQIAFLFCFCIVFLWPVHVKKHKRNCKQTKVDLLVVGYWHSINPAKQT
jgi:hypothetical protein